MLLFWNDIWFGNKFGLFGLDKFFYLLGLGDLLIDTGWLNRWYWFWNVLEIVWFILRWLEGLVNMRWFFDIMILTLIFIFQFGYT